MKREDQGGHSRHRRTPSLDWEPRQKLGWKLGKGWSPGKDKTIKVLITPRQSETHSWRSEQHGRKLGAGKEVVPAMGLRHLASWVGTPG